jgi:DNA-binding protein HU-beta
MIERCRGFFMKKLVLVLLLVLAAAVKAVVDAVISAVVKGETVTLVGFGTFKAVSRRERKGRNPKTGESITVAAHKTPRFAPGKGFKDALK